MTLFDFLLKIYSPERLKHPQQIWSFFLKHLFYCTLYDVVFILSIIFLAVKEKESIVKLIF